MTSFLELWWWRGLALLWAIDLAIGLGLAFIWIRYYLT